MTDTKNSWDFRVTTIEGMMDLIGDYLMYYENPLMGPTTAQVEAGLRSLIAASGLDADT